MYVFFNSKFAKRLLTCSPLLFVHIHKYYPNIDPTRVEKTEKHVFNGLDNVKTEVSNALEGLVIFSLKKKIQKLEKMDKLHLGLKKILSYI